MMAPNYLTEEYNATAFDPDEANRQRIHVVLQVNPFHPDEPGLRIHYPYSVSLKQLAHLFSTTFANFLMHTALINF